jgi:NAD(P)H-flavin reductase
VLLTVPIREILLATPRARIVRLELEGRPFPFRAGQALSIATHGAEKRRPYSIASAPEDVERDGWLELLVGVNAEGSAGAHLELAPGALVDVEGPAGRFTFPDAPEERRFVFVAGGTGISPLRSMMRHALSGEHKEIGLLYSARVPGEFAYLDEFRELAETGRIELKLKITRDTPVEDWTGHRGRIDRDDLAPLVHNPETLCFVCGPPALVDDIPRVLQELGIERRRIRIEEW